MLDEHDMMQESALFPWVDDPSEETTADSLLDWDEDEGGWECTCGAENGPEDDSCRRCGNE